MSRQLGPKDVETRYRIANRTKISQPFDYKPGLFQDFKQKT